MKNIFFLVVLSTLIFSCEKDNDGTPAPQLEGAKVNVMVEWLYDGEPFHLDSAYITSANDTIRTSILEFFVSNISLTGDEGLSFSETPSYHLVTKKNEMMMSSFQVSSIPSGAYHMFNFGLGVDQEANHSLDHTTEGDLDPAVSQGMLWSWDTGYKFLKFEGASGSQEGVSGAYTYHVGGDANYKDVMIHQMMSLEEGQEYDLHMQLDVKTLLGAIDVVDAPAAHGDAGSVFMTNLKEAIVLHHFEIVND